jgi:hypothetical protein
MRALVSLSRLDLENTCTALAQRVDENGLNADQERTDYAQAHGYGTQISLNPCKLAEVEGIIRDP